MANKELIYTDDLTGLYNRRYLNSVLPQELAQTKKYALFMIDLDGFKGVNDTYGHLEGDAILISLSKAINECMSASGTVIRYAGDEFTVVLPEKTKEEASSLAGELLKKVAAQPLKGKDGQKVHSLTLSMGLSMYPDDGKKLEEIIEKADRALYSSKRKGKNRLTTSDQIMPEVEILSDSAKYLSHPSFVNRRDELALLTSVIGGTGKRAVIISGSSGVGKTRLLDEVRQDAESKGIKYIRINSFEEDMDKPYTALAGFMEEYFNLLSPDELKQLSGSIEKSQLYELKSILPSFKDIDLPPEIKPVDDPSQRRLNLIEGILKIVERMSQDAGRVLAIDDFHWVDAASLEIFYYIVRMKESKVFLLATVLQDTQPILTEKTSLPYKQLYTKPDYTDIFEELEIAPLSQDYVKELLRVIFKEIEVEPASFDAFYRRTSGNPFFIAEALKLFIEKGSLYYKDKKWILGKLEEKEIPKDAGELAKERFEKLDQEMKDMLINAAFLGKDFNLDMLKKLSQRNEGYVLDKIDAAEKLGIARMPQGAGFGRFDFVNKLSRESLYNILDKSSAKNLHKKIAQSLEAYLRDNKDMNDILLHYRKAEDSAKTAEYNQKVAEFQESIFSYDELQSYIDKRLEAESGVSVEELLEKPLSQKGKGLLVDILNALRVGVEKSILYPANNQARISAIGDAYKELQKIFETDTSITFSCVEGELLINGEVFGKKEVRQTLGISWVNILTERRITSITFKKGLSERELSFFFDIMSRPEQYLAAGGGYYSFLRENNILSIKIDEVRYEKSSEIAKKTKKILKAVFSKDPLLENIIQRQEEILQKLKSSGDTKEALKAFIGITNSIVESKSEPDAKAQMLMDSLQNIIGQMKQGNPEAWEQSKQELYALFSALDPSVKSSLLNKYIPQPGLSGDAVSDIFNILRDAKPKETTVDSVVEDFLLIPPSRYLEKGFASHIKSIIESLIWNKKEDLLNSVVEKMLKDLSHPLTEIRSGIVNNFDYMLDIFLSNGKYAILRKITRELGSRVSKEDDSRTFTFSVDILIKAVKGFLLHKKFQMAREILEALSAVHNEYVQQVLDGVAERRFIDIIVNAFKKGTVADNESIVFILKGIGPKAVEYLIMMIEEQTIKDPFEQFVVRRNASGILSGLGKVAVDKLRERLLVANPAVLKNVIEALGYIEDKTAIPFLEKMADNPSGAVRAEIVDTLRKLKCPESVNALALFLRDKSKDIHDKALSALIKIVTKETVPELEKFLSDKEIGADIKKIVGAVK